MQLLRIVSDAQAAGIPENQGGVVLGADPTGWGAGSFANLESLEELDMSDGTVLPGGPALQHVSTLNSVAWRPGWLAMHNARGSGRVSARSLPRASRPPVLNGCAWPTNPADAADVARAPKLTTVLLPHAEFNTWRSAVRGLRPEVVVWPSLL